MKRKFQRVVVVVGGAPVGAGWRVQCSRRQVAAVAVSLIWWPRQRVRLGTSMAAEACNTVKLLASVLVALVVVEMQVWLHSCICLLLFPHLYRGFMHSGASTMLHCRSTLRDSACGMLCKPVCATLFYAQSCYTLHLAVALNAAMILLHAFVGSATAAQQQAAAATTVATELQRVVSASGLQHCIFRERRRFCIQFVVCKINWLALLVGIFYNCGILIYVCHMLSRLHWLQH